MKFICPLVVVEDIERSRTFFEKTLGQKVIADYGPNVVFESGFAIHLKSHWSGLIEVDPNKILRRSNNFELYFENEDLDSFVEKLKESEIEYVHPLREQPWGQRVIRFYDPDQHIIEVGEPMECVVKRFLSRGLSADEVAERVSMPVEFVQQFAGE
jgi:catechol 2,3-dioxygenase-like lactoylglutathione lyase family enzyme